MMSNRDYYGDSYGTPKERKSIFWFLAWGVFAVVSIVLWVALLFTLVAPRVNPEVWWGFSILGLLAPVTYIVNFAIAMVWIIRWRWRVALPIIVLLLVGSPKVTQYVKMETSNHYSEPSRRGMTKILSYNLRFHINDDQEWSTNEIVSYIDSIAPDIICLQELRVERFEDALTDKLKRYNSATSADLGIYTKYPIIARSEYISLRDCGESSSMWVDLKIANDTIRVFNNHLVSTTINHTDDKYITSREFIADSLREDKVVDIITRFNSRSEVRAHDSDSLKRIITASPHRMVVCGDFNDTPMSYTYHTMAKGLKDSFVECGVGVPYTYRGFMNWLRIDYILAQEGIEFQSYMIDKEIKLSDHLPVIAHFILTKNN